MKILYFTRSFTPHDARFLTAIAVGGHDVFFARLEGSGATAAHPLPQGVQEISWQGKLQSIIDEVKPDLIHAGPLHTCGFLAAKTKFRPLVLMSWGSDILWEARRKTLVRERVKLALSRAAAVIGDCDAVRAAIEELGAPKERIVTFPWGVDLARFNPHGGDGGLRARLGWQNQFILLHLRSWESLYDPLTVARVFARASHHEPRLRLLMPSGGRLEKQIKAIFERHQVLERVHFPGQLSQTDLPQYFRAADLYVSASLSDGSSVSLMESLASGLPALVSDIPGNRDWIRPGKEGWLFLPKDVNTLSDKILQAVRQPALLQPMGKQARQTAEARADWTKNKQGLYRAYDLALKGAH